MLSYRINTGYLTTDQSLLFSASVTALNKSGNASFFCLAAQVVHLALQTHPARVVLQLVKLVVTVKQRHRFKSADTITQCKVSHSSTLDTCALNPAHLQFLC